MSKVKEISVDGGPTVAVTIKFHVSSRLAMAGAMVMIASRAETLRLNDHVAGVDHNEVADVLDSIADAISLVEWNPTAE